MAGACYDFTYEGPPAGSDGGARADAGACVVDRLYCGGDVVSGAVDTLYRCVADGGGALVARCAGACVGDGGPDASNANAHCKPPAAPCKVGGNYCGGDKLDGDPTVLYRCQAGGEATILSRCAKECRIMPAGTDDQCAP